MTVADHASEYMRSVTEIAGQIQVSEIDGMARGIAGVRERRGRLFIVGVGGGAGHASHAVNDFRKLCHIESYAPSDNVSELTARANDDGWDTTYVEWLRISRLGPADALLVFSVGGGSREHNVSMNLVRAMELATEVSAPIYAIVGKDDGEAARVAEIAIVVSAPASLRTPLVEAFQAVVWHALVSHPALAAQAGKWETVEAAANPG